MAMNRLLLLLLPGGAVIYAASLLLRCRHQHELWDRVDGKPVLRCADCFRVRPNILGDAVPAYKPARGARRETGHVAPITKPCGKPHTIPRFDSYRKKFATSADDFCRRAD